MLYNGFGAGEISRHSVRYSAQITKRTGKTMIDEYYTWIIFGYRTDELSKWAKVPVVAVCDKCYEYRVIRYDSYRDLCRRCTQIGKKHSAEHIKKAADGKRGRRHTDEARRRMSVAQRRRPPPPPITNETRKRMSISQKKRPQRSEETRIKMSVSGKNKPPRSQEWCNNISKSKKGTKATDETRLKMSITRKGKKVGKYTEERCQRISAGKQGIPFDEWTEFVRDGEYCHAFNEEIKERVRNKYNRICFVCDKDEKTNGRKLDTHHTDISKSQGCDGEAWKLVPLCRSCHSSAHAEPMKSRIEYLRADEEHSQV